MSSRLINPFIQQITINGEVGSGWKMYFYQNNTTTPQDTYSDAALTTPNANPVVADSRGQFGAIFLDDDLLYSVKLTDSSDVEISTADNVGQGGFVNINTLTVDTLYANEIYQNAVPVLDQSDVVSTDADETSSSITNVSWVNAKVAEINERLSEFVGQIAMFATINPPAGWLECDGSAISRESYSGLFELLVTDSGFASTAFSVTIANPAVFTATAHGMNDGARIRLSTTGDLPTGLDTSTDYYVYVVDDNTFNVSTEIDGALVETSGSQSGTHTYLQSWWGLGNGTTTFNLPDLRGEFIRGWDDARGIDTGRTFGSWQQDAIRNIVGEVEGGAVEEPATMTGAFQRGSLYSGASAGNQDYGIKFDASLVVPTATENRPRNIALLACIKF